MFAVDVRSEGGYGPAAGREIDRKRTDAGTPVWDVALLGRDVVRVYRSVDTYEPTVYRRGQVAEAEPTLPGWTVPVDDLFPQKRTE